MRGPVWGREITVRAAVIWWQLMEIHQYLVYDSETVTTSAYFRLRLFWVQALFGTELMYDGNLSSEPLVDTDREYVASVMLLCYYAANPEQRGYHARMYELQRECHRL